jgi:hypothetical protein
VRPPPVVATSHSTIAEIMFNMKKESFTATETTSSDVFTDLLDDG